MATLDEMKTAVLQGNTKILTIDRAKSLTGKRIATIFFNLKPPYDHKVDEFVIGEMKSAFDLHPNPKSVLKELKDRPHLIKRMKATVELLTQDGRRTLLQAAAYKSVIFTGAGLDNEVWFKEL